MIISAAFRSVIPDRYKSMIETYVREKKKHQHETQHQETGTNTNIYVL